MMTVEQALESVLSQTLPKEVERVDLRKSQGRILAEPVTADRDAPPFDRVTMDGIALQAEALGKYSSFEIEKTQPAGSERASLVNAGGCIEVMTGAVLPADTNCVIPYEQVEIKNGQAFPLNKEYSEGQNIHPQGKDAKKGDMVLDRGKTVTASVAAFLASVGMADVKVLKLPKVAVCSTGDELVDIEDLPLPHQIRKSNAIMLEAALLGFGIQPDIFHFADDKDNMASQLSSMAENYSILLFSGAVSKGKYDFLPAVLEGLGMKKIVHGVAQKPGKPFLFGTLPKTLIFGFPGNPVSTFVCFHMYFKPWLRQYLGLPYGEVTAVLDVELVFDKPLTYHLLVSLSIKDGQLTARPVPNSGSGDLVHLSQADALLSLPSDKEVFSPGEAYPLNLLRNDLFYM